MKRAVVIFLAVLMCLSFACCGKKTATDAEEKKEKAVVSCDNDTEQMIVATVKEVNGNNLLLLTDNAEEYAFNYSDKVKVVEGEYYVTGVKASDLLGKKVVVIAGNQVQETWPMGLTGERLIILAE